MKLPAENSMGVNRLRLGQNVLIWLWALEKCSERDSTDSSQGVLLGMELKLKLWELCPEIIYICILQPSKNSHTIFKFIEAD